MSAIVAIVGRPNVGKSTLFNRLVGRRRAIESSVPGTTRDRLYEQTTLGNLPVLLVDTGGLEIGTDGSDLESNVQDQSQIAISGADLILFVVDVREDPTAEDFHAAELLRKSRKPVLLIANKCDNPNLEDQRYNLYELGFGEPIAVTALHSFGVGDLEERAEEELKKLGFAEPVEVDRGAQRRIRIAFLGRPNVGKSTLVNGLFGKQRVVVSEVPGTTRDATEIPFEYDGTPFTLVDTAGIRRRGKVESGIEKYSILRTLQSVDEADVCVLLIDQSEGVTNQDCHVSQYILEQKKGLILVVNKIDIYEAGKERERAEHMTVHDLRKNMSYLPWAPVIFASGLERRNIFAVLDQAKHIASERSKRIPADDLRVWLQMALDKHPPSMARGKHRFEVKSVEQAGVNPPRFIFTCTWPEVMHFSYSRYLENSLREQFGFVGTALKLVFRKAGSGPRRLTLSEETLAEEEAADGDDFEEGDVSFDGLEDEADLGAWTDEEVEDAHPDSLDSEDTGL